MVFGAYMLVDIWQNNQCCGRDRRRRSATRCATRSTSPSSRPRSRAPASASCGGTPRRPRSSWATPARSPSAARWPGSRSSPAPSSCSCSSAACSSSITLSVILQVGFFKLTRADGSSGWRRCTTTSSCSGWEEITIVIRFWIIAGHLRGRRARDLLRRVGRRLVSSTSTTSAGETPTGAASGSSSAGFGVSGFAAADALTFLGAQVTALDESRGRATAASGPQLLESLGADVRLGPGATATLPDDVDLVVTSPGWRPRPPLLAAAAERGVPVWGEVELAWRLRDPRRRRRRGWRSPAPTARPRPCGCSRRCCGPPGCARSPRQRRACRSCEVVMDPEPYDVLAVELSSFQLHWTHSMRAESAARAQRRARTTSTGTARLDGATPRDKGRDLRARRQRGLRLQRRRPGDRAARRARPRSSRAAGPSASPSAPRPSACSASSTTCWPTARSSRTGRPRAAELGTLDDLRRPPRPAQRRQRPGGRRAGPRPRRARRRRPRRRCAPSAPTAHRIAEVGRGRRRHLRRRLQGHQPARRRSPRCAAYDPVVWVAGGLAKGAAFDDLVAEVRDRLRGVVLLGATAPVIARGAGATRAGCPGDRRWPRRPEIDWS